MGEKRSRQLNRLTVLEIEAAKGEGWYPDGGGLNLEVDANGNRRWKLRLTVNGRRRDFGLGPLAIVSLKQARERAVQYRSLAYQGIDPTAQKHKSPKPEKVAPTFQECAKKVFDLRRQTWSNGKHVNQWINTLYEYAFPAMGSKPIDIIATADVLEVLSPIWSAKPETARRVRQRISVVLDWARAAGLRSGDNPVDLIGDALPRHGKSAIHHAALPYAEVSEFVRKLRASNIDDMSKLAFEFLILTAARTIEVRNALWSEIDLEEKLWTIPGHDRSSGRRMKSGREHIVPLTERARSLLSEAHRMSSGNQLIFPDRKTGHAMSENRFLVARNALGFTKDRCTPHGFRSSFRDWVSEETSFSPEVAELALAHSIKSKTEAAYRRGALLAKRRELMDAWTNYVLPVRQQLNVSD